MQSQAFPVLFTGYPELVVTVFAGTDHLMLEV
jgi:hypothetical protein